MLCPAVTTSRASDPAPTSPSAPRLLMVGRAGAGATRPYGSGRSGSVCAASVARTERRVRERTARHIRPSRSTAWAAKAAMNTQAP